MEPPHQSPNSLACINKVFPAPVVPGLAPIISAPIHTGDLALLGDIFTVVNTSTGLVPRERQVLLAVLPFMPVDQSNQLRGILSLELTDLKTLADTFDKGLYRARNYGGRASQTSSFGNSIRTSVNESPSMEFEPENYPHKRLRAEYGGPASPPAQLPPPVAPVAPVSISQLSGSTADVALRRALNINSALPVANPGARYSRRGSMAPDLIARQNEFCPITGRRYTNGAFIGAHMIPHSIASLKNMEDTPYWSLLTLVFGQTLRDYVYGIVGGGKSYLTSNGIGLDSSIHDMFGKGRIWLIPRLTAPFDQLKTTQYDVVFRWRGELRDLKGLSTLLPVHPEEQIDFSSEQMTYHTPGIRAINDGDAFRLFTHDPEKFPLPHPLLLELHSRLWNMLANSGISETSMERKKIGEALVQPRKRVASGSRRGKGPVPKGDLNQHSGGDSTADFPDINGSRDASTSTYQHTQNAWAQDGTADLVETLPIETEYLMFKLTQLAAEQMDEVLWSGSEEDTEYEEDRFHKWGV